MGTKINHVAIVSDAYAMAQQFYQAVFSFKSSPIVYCQHVFIGY